MDGLFQGDEEAPTLRGYQGDAIDRLRASLQAGKRRPVLQLPTGGGKTVIAGEIIRLAREKNRRVAFCVPALSLIDQTMDSFSRHGIRDIGVMQADHPETDAARSVQICSVQTLGRRQKPKSDLIIVDECHRRSEVIEGWMREPAMATVPFIGLSATPWTQGLGKIYDDLIVCATTAQMIPKYLVPFRVFAPAHPDLQGVRVVRDEMGEPDYHKGDLSEAMRKGELVADIVQTWVKRADNRPTLCFCVDRAHAKHVQQQFAEAGVACGYVDAYTERGERRMVRDKFKARKFQVVANVGVLTTGVDWPEIACVIFARPTRSEMLFVQIAGRGLRPADGKEDCLFLDHSDNHLRLGFVTDIHHETLDDGKPVEKSKQLRKKPMPTECPKCSYLRPAKVATCPNCGFKPQAVSHVRADEGELEEITHGAAQRKANREKVFKSHGVEIQQGDFYAQLLGYAIGRGIKRGWAAHKYRDYFGVWPNAHKNAAPKPASPAIVSWIKSRNIAWAKRRPVSETMVGQP